MRKTIKKIVRLFALARDKHCNGCGWAANTSLTYCPRCGRELSDD